MSQFLVAGPSFNILLASISQNFVTPALRFIPLYVEWAAFPPLIARPALPTKGINPAAASAPYFIRSAAVNSSPVTGSTPVVARTVS